MSVMGFGDELLAEEFRRSKPGTADVIELVGFGVAEPKDTSTAVVVAQDVHRTGDRHLESIFDAAADLAAPIVLAGEDETYRVFASATRAVVLEGPWAEVYKLRQYSSALAPKALLDAKKGNRQLSLFNVPADALANARRRHRAALGDVVAQLLEELGAGTRILRLPNVPQFLDRQRLAYRAVGSALCAMVLVDKSGTRGSTDQILQVAKGRVRSLFDWFTDESNPAHEMLVHAIETLAREIDFRKFDSNVLSRVYEEVLVEPDQRRRLGIHYTPLEVAEKMLRNLPVEDIAPEERQVLDPACGSGTLLVAAHDRLRELHPSYWDSSQRHQDLRSRLHGRDRDPLAVELTRLALVLHAVPAGNGWQIEEGDSLDERLYLTPTSSGEREANAPSIVVANPPFDLPVNDGARLDIAVRFLDVILRQLRPGGIFGVVLPASWLSGTGLTRASRERVKSTCEVTELWRLPRDTFSLSRASTVVLIGRKRRHGEILRSTPSLLQRVPRVESLREFYAGEDSGTIRYISDPLARTGAIAAELESNPDLTTIDYIATPRTGAQPVPGHLEQVRAGAVRDDGVRWLPQLGRLPQFTTVPDDVLLSTSWPAGFLRNILRSDVDSPKILIGTQATEEAPWLRVIIDERGILASKSLLWLVPKEDRLIARSLGVPEVNWALLTICGSALMAAWLDEISTGRNIRGTDVRRFPVPRSDAAWQQLADAGRRLHGLAQSGQISADILRQIDQRVFEAYGLKIGSGVAAAITRRLEGVGDPALAGQPRYPGLPRVIPQPPRDPIDCDGTVLAVEPNRVLLQVSGVTPADGTWTAIPPKFPGYLCRAGRHFIVRLGDDDNLFAGDYSLHRSAWRTVDDLVADLHRRQMASAIE
jgi:SAM-dependent methyltransferase